MANTIIFAIAIIGLLLFGFKSPGISLATYSIGHIYAYIAVIAGTAVLYLLARYLKGKAHYYYPLSLLCLAVIGAAILSVVSPQFFNQLINAAIAVFRAGTGDRYGSGGPGLVHGSRMDNLQLRPYPPVWRHTGYPV